MLSGYRYQSLPDLSGKRDPVHSGLSITRSVRLQLHEEFHQSNIDLQSIIRAAFAKVLLGYVDSTEFLFGELQSVPHDQPSSLALLRVSLSDHDTCVTFVQQIKQRAGAHGGVSPEFIGSSLGLPSEVNPLPARFVCGTLAALTSVYSDGLLLLGIPHSRTDGEPHLSSQDSGLVELSAVCDSAIMSEPALQNYIDQVCATAQFISANPTMPLASTTPLPRNLMSAYEEDYDSSRAHVVVNWLMHNTATRPDAIAHEIYKTLEEPPVLLSYAELNSQSNMLAHWFIKQGIQLEDKVAVCRARDEHFYIANASLFKCGACYISASIVDVSPASHVLTSYQIDPELPLERRQFIVRDSGAKFVVTTASLAPDFGDAALVPESAAMTRDISEHSSDDICLAQLDSLAYLLYTSGEPVSPVNVQSLV
jgi:hypothetical protein